MISSREMDIKHEEGISMHSESHEMTPDKIDVKSKQTKSMRKRKRRRSTSDEDIDTSIDDRLEQSALRNNLTPQNVKNILQKVVRNDHVLAIVKLKEEALERKELASKETHNSLLNAEQTTTSSETATPKLTRAKAKALNIAVPEFKHSAPDSEVIALIHEELHSDDDDDEYQPGEEEIESDDDINTTASDLDSQPATPSSQVDPQEIVYSHDGLFKVPRARNDSNASLSEQEYIIAQRTRSKISLTGTPIEAIESTFRAPDAPPEIYQPVEIDLDPSYAQFLSNLGKPLPSDIEKEDDNENDPDPDFDPVIFGSQPENYREEFQQGSISKKEFTDLLNDVFNINDLDFDDLLKTYETNVAIETNADPKPSIEENLNESLITPIKPDINPIQPQASESPLQPGPSDISYFDPYAISTPARPNFNNNTISPVPYQQLSFESFNSTLLSLNESVVPVNGFSVSPMQDKSPLIVTATASAFVPFFITIPSVETPLPSLSTQLQQMNRQIESGVQTAKNKPGCRAKRSRFKNAAYSELENINPIPVAPQNFATADERNFTIEQRRILDCQLRIHTQLATQSYIQTYGHPELYREAPRMKRLLTELATLSTATSIYNLQPALDLIKEWEDELSVNSKDNTELVAYQREEMRKLHNNLSYSMQFHERILRLMCYSKVFIYPELLPARPFRFSTKKPSEYFPGEDYLLAFLLEHFFFELRRKNALYKFSKPKEVTLAAVCHNISAHLDYFRSWKSIYDYIRLRRNSTLMNPIKFYFIHERSPPVHHRCEIFNPNFVIEPANQPLSELPHQWATFVEKLIGCKHDEVLQKINESAVASCESVVQHSKEKKTTKELPLPSLCNQNPLDDNSSVIHVKILYDSNNVNDSVWRIPTDKATVGKCGENDDTATLIKGQTFLTSFFQPIRKKQESTETTVEKLPELQQFPCLLFKCTRNIVKKYIRLKITKNLIRRKLTQFLVDLSKKSRKQYSVDWNLFQCNKRISYVYKCLITYHRFSAEFLRQHGPHPVAESTKMSTDSLLTHRRMQNITSNAKDSNEETVTNATHPQNDGGIKGGRPKKATDNNRLLLLTDNLQESAEKDSLFAQRFIERLEEITKDNHHKYVEVLDTLRRMNENQHRTSGADIYLLIEKILMPDYPDLMDLFLHFLLPDDAVAINRSMDYFFEVNYTKFLQKLNICFQKQPAQIRKVLACFKELSDNPDVKFEQVRAKVLPLLKGNQLLIDWFLQCVGPDKCESSKDEYETLVLRKGLNESFDDDQFEYIPQSEIVADPNDNPCHIRYFQGRIFYGNRFPLPAKLSFGAAAVAGLSEPSDKHEDSSTSTYHCVHNIKEFADNKMRDRHMHVDLGSDNSDEEREDEKIEQSSSASSAAIMRAHSIRLNPTELLSRLKLPDQLQGDNVQKELKLSPKKHTTASKCVRKMSASPNAKKSASVGYKSPNSKKTTSPVSTDCSTNTTTTQESNAVQTAKKLKRILESEHDCSATSKSHMISKPIKKRKYFDTDDDKEENPPAVQLQSQLTWTREEDRLLLEQIKAGLDVECLTGFTERFPNKTQEQIQNRIDFLIDFLTKLRNKNKE